MKQCSDDLTCTKGRCSNCGPSVPKDCTHSGNVDYFAPYNNENVTYQAECGPDSNGCGETCGPLNGGCPSGEKCSLQMGICVPVPSCDRNVPICLDPLPNYSPPKKKRWQSQAVTDPQYFCDSFCHWREINEPLPDIVPNEQSWFTDSFLMQALPLLFILRDMR